MSKKSNVYCPKCGKIRSSKTRLTSLGLEGWWVCNSCKRSSEVVVIAAWEPGTTAAHKSLFGIEERAVQYE